MLSLTVLALWAFLGLEFVCPMVEETRRPERAIPTAMVVSACILLVVCGGVALAGHRTVPGPELLASTVPHWVLVKALLGDSGRVFARLGRRTQTPWVSVLTLGALSVSASLTFAGLMALACSTRSDPPAHKRSIVVANVALTCAGFIRWPVEPFFHNIPVATRAPYVLACRVSMGPISRFVATEGAAACTTRPVAAHASGLLNRTRQCPSHRQMRTERVPTVRRVVGGHRSPFQP